MDSNDIPKEFYNYSEDDWLAITHRGGGLWQILKHSFGWTFVDAIDSKTKLGRPCFIRTKYRGINKSELTEGNRDIVYFSSPETIAKYMEEKIFHNRIKKGNRTSSIVHLQELSRYGHVSDNA